MTTVKQIIKNFTPPILMKVLKRLFQKPIWAGHYQNWEEAQKHSFGYSSPIILEKVRAALRQVKIGKAAYERDSVIFEKNDENNCFLSALLYCVAKYPGNLNIFDFGGSLGSTYYQTKNILSKLHIKHFSWHVIEQKHFAEAGNEEFRDQHLQFFTTIESALVDFPKAPKVLLMSASLQYLQDPYKKLRDILETHDFDFIILARIPLHFEVGSRLTIQTVPPSIYTASYPCWFFDQRELEGLFLPKYEVAMTFGAPDVCMDFPSEFKGFLFERRPE